jgi:ankyrin repeat protein
MSTSPAAAVNNNDLELVKNLIENGADVNQTDSSGNSLLIISSANGQSEMVKLLLDSGADIHAVDSSMKATARHAAAYLRHPEVMKILIEYGINIDAQGPYNGYTALHDAVWQNNKELGFW